MTSISNSPRLGSNQASTSMLLQSFTGDQWYGVSLDKRACSCPQFAKTLLPCKHLNALGIYGTPRPFVARTHPTFSQALSALVKSIRLRRVEDAVYWLAYLDTFKEPQSRFRTARRILIGSAEDGHSISVMEKVVDSFKRISNAQSKLEELATEIVRICNVPNWWNPSTGGHDYIYYGIVAERQLWQLKMERNSENFMNMVVQAIIEQDKAKALAAAMGFTEARFGGTKQAEFMLECAKKADHKLAARLAMVHLKAKGALSSDNNFICQSAWMLAGGQSPVAEVIEPVHSSEVLELLKKARGRWKDPKPIPGWCCDGVHSSGNDVRFMGAWQHMYAVCNAFKHYGRVSPDDEWLPDFQCYDGLTIRWAGEVPNEAGNQLQNGQQN
jgi:SWIM zinc finger